MRLMLYLTSFSYFSYLFVNTTLSELYYLPKLDSQVKMKTTNATVPWMGVLRVKRDLAKSKDFVSIVTLIAKNFAIACAEDISKINKKVLNSSTIVTFYNVQLIPWSTVVADYYLHPEYDDDTINTISVLKLHSEIKIPDFMWQPVRWPKNFQSYCNNSSVYKIEFNDKGLILEQGISRLKYVKKQECINFYKSEGMDFKKIWPTHYSCFKDIGENTSCVYDSGMAVATNESGRWTLIGISTFGPGCSVPARYIEFFPYIPWVESLMQKENPERIIYSRRYTWKDEPGEDFDSKILAIFYNYTVDIFPTVEKDVYWNITGTCPNNSRNVIYREKGYIKLTAPVPSASVFFAVSLFDDNFDIQCVKVRLDCVAKSKTELFVQRGFGQENLEPLIKQLVPPDLTGQMPDKVLYITDNYQRYSNKTVTTVWFKFIFIRTGRIDVSFYGLPKPPTTTTTETVATARPPGGTTASPPETTTTTRRPYDKYLLWDIYKSGKGG